MIIKDSNSNIFTIMAIQIKNDTVGMRRFAVSAKLPIKIGCDLRICPACGGVLSFAYDRYFCRGCNYDPAGQPCEI